MTDLSLVMKLIHWSFLKVESLMVEILGVVSGRVKVKAKITNSGGQTE